MSLWSIVLKSLRHHALSTMVTAFAVALASGLLMSVWAVKEQSQRTFTGVNAGFDAVLGARGSKLQLVLNSIFHLEASPGIMPWSDYEEIAQNSDVDLAVPIAVGDNFRGYRLVGTILTMFEKNEYAPGQQFEVEAGGRLFDQTLREAVVGSFAATKLGLKPGDPFHPFHGLIYDEKNQHAETYLVVGVLKPSNTPADRVIWIPIAGLQKMSGHDAKAATDVSAVLVRLKGSSPTAGFQMDNLYNKQGNRLTFAWPVGRVMAELFNKIAWFGLILELVSYLVAVVAMASILAGIYNSMNERRREIAILRALGARRGTVFSAIVLEAAAITTAGIVAGFVIYGIIMTVVTNVIQTETGVVLNPLQFNWVMVWSPAALIALGAVAGIVPAIKAYRTDVAEYLSPLS